MDTHKNTYIWIIVILLIIVGLFGAAYYFSKDEDTDSLQVSDSRITSLEVLEGNFIIHGSKLGHAEVWIIPAGSTVTEASYSKLGDATRLATDGDKEAWSLKVPNDPFLATEIFAKGFSLTRKEIGRVSLSTKGASAISDLLWGSQGVYDSLKIGEKKVIGPVTIELLKIVEDSRCPKDVQCIQAGRGRVEVNLTMGGESEKTIIASDGDAYKIADYYVEISAVDPGPVSTKKILDSEYQVTFTVTRDVKG